jgi:phospholipase A-2-activating protein
MLRKVTFLVQMHYSIQVGDHYSYGFVGLNSNRTGKKPGEVKMIKNGDIVEAHQVSTSELVRYLSKLDQWDSATSSWQKIGEVVDAVGSGRKQLYNGKEYDYVFDVDVQEGAPPLKLPFNVSGKYFHITVRCAKIDTFIAENPYAAAQRFLEQNNLPLNHTDEVVKFIEKSTSGVNLGVNNEYVDPYTGRFRCLIE